MLHDLHTLIHVYGVFWHGNPFAAIFLHVLFFVVFVGVAVEVLLDRKEAIYGCRYHR